MITADYIKAKDPGCLKKEIDACRTITSKLFYRENKPKPSLTSCSDGTGTGKSYGQLKAYIEETIVDGTAQGHRCLFFITPLKNQIDFDDKLMKTAHDKGIYFVPFLSRSDLYTLDFKNWLPDLNSKIETNKERYDRWFKIGNSLDVRGEVTQMFDKTTDSDLAITPFFAFFLPKAVFSIEKCNDLEFFEKGDGTEDVTYVDFKLDIITELPTLYDGGFYLYGVDNEIMLINYHTSRVPRVIGNRDVDSICFTLKAVS